MLVKFTLEGGAAGDTIISKTSGVLPTYTYYTESNVGTSEAIGDKLEVKAGEDKIWAFQVPAAKSPNLIIAITEVKMKDGTFLEQGDGTKVYYITARPTLSTFSRAHVYQLGTLGAGIEFTEGNLHDTPNVDLVGASLELTVNVIDWTITNLDYTLD